MPTWQHLWTSLTLHNGSGAPVSGRETTRRISSNVDSSQGIVNGPTWLKPYSSSACTRSFLNMGWFRYVARTMNLLELLPTQTATCPAGTSDGVAREAEAAIRAFLRHCLSIWRILTMWRILLHFDIFSGKWRKVWESGVVLVLVLFSRGVGGGRVELHGEWGRGYLINA